MMPWLNLAYDMTMLGLETQRVIGLRMMRLAAGGSRAESEAQRMITEKAAAFAEAGATLATGGSPQRVVRRLRATVRANERRLSRRKP